MIKSLNEIHREGQVVGLRAISMGLSDKEYIDYVGQSIAAVSLDENNTVKHITLAELHEHMRGNDEA